MSEIEAVEKKKKPRSHIPQMIGSLLAAVIIVALVITIVTAKIGPGLDSQELRERQDAQEEKAERLEESREEGAERREERRGN
ncbi:MAG: hypothetical protein M3198_19030 [Actinomycetota bacterium]|nr:hypothetical protein [Actinomycetota bacterium]